MLNWGNETFHLQRKGWRDEDAGWTFEVWLVLNSLIAGGRGCSVTEVAICENAGRDFRIGSKALYSTERRLMKEGQKTINWGLDGKDWFHFEEGTQQGTEKNTFLSWDVRGLITRPTDPILAHQTFTFFLY
ncbi:hypothetical protein AVEN_31470-1 [Araneus ventricosus]|uniref:Uncharacterized protein n=1 Tax=Araneus ventricosus TaxID=182803 RepID=A0A4Y2MSS2_ARAVE|nr:hypothetical protein AVEN_31470-1 [Araneus ventricosus]